MLELEEPNQQLDTIFSVVVADMENEMLLLMNVHNVEILAAIPLSDDVSKWLSVDPLSDKYPGVSSGISTFLVDEYLVQVEHW